MQDDAGQVSLINEVGRALSRATKSGEWIVLVCPTDEVKKGLGRVLAASLDPMAKFSGRTAVLSSGGRVSVVSSKEDMFIPAGTPYVVGFVGWGAGNDTKEMRRWQDKAAASLI